MVHLLPVPVRQRHDVIEPASDQVTEGDAEQGQRLLRDAPDLAREGIEDSAQYHSTILITASQKLSGALRRMSECQNEEDIP